MGERERPELADTVAGFSSVEVKGALLERGATVGRYLVLELLGFGGMGAVYAAYDPELDRKVAVKLVLPGGDGSVGRTRMLREAQAIARLAHPNVVTVHDVGTRVDQVFVAMELVDGVTVTNWLREKPRTLDEILEVFIQAGRGLAAAHAAGLVHRDFKPDNVLVGRDRRTRVVDFGLVHEVERPEDEPNTPIPLERTLSMDLTQAGSVMGTPAYMAPEQFLRRATDARSDQFSFCVSLFEALHGEVPWGSDDLQTTADRVLSGEIPEPDQRKVPPHVRAVLRRGLSVTPAARYPKMDALLIDLARNPRTGRRRLMLAAALAAVAAAVAVPLFARGRDGPKPCAGAADRLAGIWDPQRRSGLEQAFRATGLPYASDSARAVTRTFDRYAGEWVRSWQDSCEATQVRGEQSPEMQDLRTACLSARRSELDALIDLMLEPDARTVQRAAGAAQSLPPVAECNDLSALQAPIPPPSGEKARREVAAIRDQGARVDALVLAGRNREALAQAEALRDRTRALGYRPLEAEGLARICQIHSRAGEPEKAVAVCKEALGAAMAGKHDDTAARSLILMVQAAGDAEEFVRGHEWASLAEAALERIGNPPTRLASLHHVHGYLLAIEGKFAAAAEEHQRALALRERISPNSLDTARSLNSLAFAFDELGRYAEARAMGERALDINLAELGPSHPEVALCFNILGNVASDEGDFALATDYYQKALAIREKVIAAGADPTQLAAVLNNLGTVALEQGRYDEALDFHRRALEVREKIGPDEPDVAMSLGNIAAVHLRQGHHREALAGFRKSLAIAESKLGRDHPYVGDALFGIGDCTRLLGQLDESQSAYQRALEIRRAGARPIEIAEVEFGLARTLWQRGKRDRALELAYSARSALAGTPAGRRTLGEVDDWLRARAAR